MIRDLMISFCSLVQVKCVDFGRNINEALRNNCVCPTFCLFPLGYAGGV